MRSKQMLIVAAVALGIVGAAHVLLPGAPAAAGIPDQVLLETFEADMRGVAIRWSEEDARPEPERRKALFDFVYQTYESSAWIPQSLFDRNLVTQTIAGSVDSIVSDRVGLVLWPGTVSQRKSVITA
jgi:hypothetical protein